MVFSFKEFKENAMLTHDLYLSLSLKTKPKASHNDYFAGIQISISFQSFRITLPWRAQIHQASALMVLYYQAVYQNVSHSACHLFIYLLTSLFIYLSIYLFLASN